jgi:hypothetical protein
MISIGPAPQRRTRWLAFVLALGAPACHPPLKPTESQPVKGTYTFTVTPSSTCRVRGSWQMRADINQNGRDLDIELSEGDFNNLLFGDKLNRFSGQDNPDGVVLFSRGGFTSEYLFDEAKAGAWHHGQARGQFRGDRIILVFDGTFSPYGNLDSDADACRASDHSWAFVRR